MVRAQADPNHVWWYKIIPEIKCNNYSCYHKQLSMLPHHENRIFQTLQLHGNCDVKID